MKQESSMVQNMSKYNTIVDRNTFIWSYKMSIFYPTVAIISSLWEIHRIISIKIC